MAHLMVRQDELLSRHTTLALGGPARYFIDCPSVDALREGIAHARDRGLPLLLLGGGSNIVVADEGFPGVVLHLTSQGITSAPHGGRCTLRVAAGEPWDKVVQACLRQDLVGVECLSGIPGTTGATPIQNVGAYGQEVSDTITAVHALEIASLQSVSFTARECGFRYRWSRFKGPDAGRFVLTEVEFDLPRSTQADIRYPELAQAIRRDTGAAPEAGHRPTLAQTRETVLRLRAAKGMLLDPADPDARSAGSFFTNPVIESDVFALIQAQWQRDGNDTRVPSYPGPDGVKIPAAWLVEHAGFSKGLRRGGVGVSSKHALALVNHSGSTRELLALAREIQEGVRQRFNVRLEMEPVVVPAELRN